MPLTDSLLRHPSHSVQPFLPVLCLPCFSKPACFFGLLPATLCSSALFSALVAKLSLTSPCVSDTVNSALKLLKALCAVPSIFVTFWNQQSDNHAHFSRDRMCCQVCRGGLWECTLMPLCEWLSPLSITTGFSFHLWDWLFGTAIHTSDAVRQHIVQTSLFWA